MGKGPHVWTARGLMKWFNSLESGTHSHSHYNQEKETSPQHSHARISWRLEGQGDSHLVRQEFKQNTSATQRAGGSSCVFILLRNI